jgi:hypothetical protein
MSKEEQGSGEGVRSQESGGEAGMEVLRDLLAMGHYRRRLVRAMVYKRKRDPAWT